MLKDYPDELTIRQADRFKDFESFYELEEAKGYAERTGGQIYTQVDSGSDYPDRLYSKGIRFVNRTGVYIVVRHSRHASSGKGGR
jgi:hypothetical protein